MQDHRLVISKATSPEGQKFKAILGCKASSKLAWAKGDPVKQTNKTKQKQSREQQGWGDNLEGKVLVIQAQRPEFRSPTAK